MIDENFPAKHSTEQHDEAPISSGEVNVVLIDDKRRRQRRMCIFRDPELHWKATTVLICLYGIIKEFRPATPFLTPYLVSPFKNFTDVELYSQIYPFWTYSYLIALVPIFFLTDILRYKAIIVLEASCLCGTWALLIWGTTIWQMQLMQIIFGIASAAEIAYYSYMYAVVDQKHYKQITSYIRAAALIGKFFAFGLAQYLVSTGYGSYLLLNQISFGSVCVIFLIAIMLPSISSKMIANKIRTETTVTDDASLEQHKQLEQQTDEKTNDNSSESVVFDDKPPTVENGIIAYFRAIWNHFRIYKNNRIILKWSLWWALTTCGVYQVFNYVQTLWATMQTDGADTMNGVTECANTLIGAFMTFAVQYLQINWIKHGEMALFLTSSSAAILIFALSQTTNIIWAYILYVIVATIYRMLITAASANIAAQLNSASYGLVFGWNSFLALLLQTILTIAVADKHGFALHIRAQFIVYSCYFGVVAILFTVILVWKCFKRRLHLSRTQQQSAISMPRFGNAIELAQLNSSSA